uniref:Uncharacterized protein n=1 Tax=Parascaris equorum TaxID=6256 RepID=A0A914RKI6_PAREQ
MRAMVNGLKGEYEERDVDETLAPEEQAQEVGNEFANAVASTMRSVVALSPEGQHSEMEVEDVLNNEILDRAKQETP